MILIISCGGPKLPAKTGTPVRGKSMTQPFLIARRHLMLGGLAALAPLSALAAPGAKPVIPGAIHQEADFTVAPSRVYQVLTDEKAFAAMSGAPAKIAPGEGGAFSLFGGVITGRTVELVDGKRVVQAWHDTAWAVGLYSIIRFELTPMGGGTHLSFDQAGFPESDRASLVAGWHSHYWEPMKITFRKG
jgi:activator of HSP90 ATPase